LLRRAFGFSTAVETPPLHICHQPSYVFEKLQPLLLTDLIRKVVIARHEAILKRALIAIVVRLLHRKSGQAAGCKSLLASNSYRMKIPRRHIAIEPSLTYIAFYTINYPSCNRKKPLIFFINLTRF